MQIIAKTKPSPLKPPKRYSFVPRDAKPEPIRGVGTVPLTDGVVGVQAGNIGSNDIKLPRGTV